MPTAFALGLKPASLLVQDGTAKAVPFHKTCLALDFFKPAESCMPNDVSQYFWPMRPSRFIDLSHTVTHGLVTYKGLPAPIICDYLSREASRKLYAPGIEFQIGKIEMVANTGTYLDSPFHRYADGKDLSQLELEKLANLPAIKIDARHKQSIDASNFSRNESLAGKAVLVETGWSEHWNTPLYYEGHPFLTEDAARFLSDSGVALVGIDSYNIDDIQDLRRPVHSILLGNEISIVEHMTNLAAVPPSQFRFFAAPVKIKGFGTFPVRAFAIV